YAVDTYQGAIYSAGNPNGLPAVFDYVMEPYVNDNYVGGVYVAEIDQARRSLVVGPTFEDGLLITRRVYSPAAGGFVRLHDEITNTLPYERTVVLRIYHEMEDDGVFTPDGAVSPTTLTFVSAESPAMAVAGFVLGGAGAPVAASRLELPEADDPDDDASYAYVVRVPAFGTVGLLQFAAQRAPSDLEGLQQQLRVLAELSDPNALTGLTAPQRAAIRNFVIP
ncbi:MAG: hypothetical protein MUF60_07565, partial [Vicinamibacterales bacterium]|nr:hypothetical protein [Vicinamibacterales bacterium]